MFYRTVAAVVLTLSAASSTAMADHHETATLQEFKEFGKLAVGRWVGDIKFIADWPGEDLGKGDRIVGYSHYSWIVDKKALEGVSVGGNTSSREFIVWDAPTKSIRFFSVNTSGSTGAVVLWKKSDGVYGWRLTGGGLADGRSHAGTGEWVFSGDGKKMTIQGQTLLGDEKLDPLKDVYKRLSR
jgi:hypothetical protein